MACLDPDGPADERIPLNRHALAGLTYGRRLEILLSSLAVISCSVGLISFNNYLMDGPFPYAVPLVFFQMAFCSIVSVVLRVLAPAWFPTMTDPSRRVHLDWIFILWTALPIGIFYAATLVLSNQAYRWLSLAFIQMMKEGNLVLVYGLSLLCGLEVWTTRHGSVIAFALFAASLTVKGELHFNAYGFCIQLCSGLSESIRLVLASLMLSGSRKIDPMSYVLIISPLVCLLTGGVLLVSGLAPPGLIIPGLPAFGEVVPLVPLLLANSVVAYLLNASIALLMARISPVSYLLVGMLKDIAVICVSVLVLKEAVSALQVFAFVLQIGSIAAWTLLKLHPEKFEDGILPGLLAMLVEVHVDGAACVKAASLPDSKA